MGCSVRGCRSTSKNGVTFCRLPTGKNDSARRNAWMKALNRIESESSTSILVCERHFLVEDWEKLREDGTKRLKKTAVPSQNLFSNNQQQTTPTRMPFSNITNNCVTPRSLVIEVPAGKPLTIKQSSLSSNIREEHTYAAVNRIIHPTVSSSSSKITEEHTYAAVNRIIHPTVSSSSSKISEEHTYAAVNRIIHPTVSSSSSKITEEHTYAAVNSIHPTDSSSSSKISEEHTYAAIDKNIHCTPSSASSSNVSLNSSLLSTPAQPSINHTVPGLPASDALLSSHSPPDNYESFEAEFQVTLDRWEKIEKGNAVLRAQVKSSEKLSQEVAFLRKAVKKERKAKYRLQNNLALSKRNLRYILNHDQFESTLRSSTRGMKFSDSSIQEGLLLKSQCGTTAYEQIAKRFNLPSGRTITGRTAHIKFRSGIIEEVLDKLNVEVPFMREEEKACIVALDEMAIVPNDRLFDPSTKEPIGSSTFPGHSGPARKALVIMVAGVSTRWKLVVAYYFTSSKDKDKQDNNSNKNSTGEGCKAILLELLTALEKLDLRVSAIVSDMGADNRAMWKAFGIYAKRSGKLNTRIIHPCSPDRYLYFVPDGPHLFKNVVHMLMSNKFIIIPKEIAAKHNLPSCEVNIQHIKDLMEFEQDHELRVAFRLHEECFQKGHFEKMKVATSRSIFNHRTKVGLELLAEKKGKPAYLTTAWFVGLFVRWSDLTTSRCHSLALSLRNPEIYDKAIAHIVLTASVFQLMIVGRRGEWKPAQEGVIMASHSILKLQEFYLKERGYKFLLTARFTQDFLENFFSQIRRRQPLPNALMFKNILKELTIPGKCCRPPRGSSYDHDEGDMLINMLTYTKQKSLMNECSNATLQTTANIDALHCPPLQDNDIYEILDDWELHVLYDMAGAALLSLIQLHRLSRDCACVSSLLWSGPSHHPLSTVTLKKNYRDGALLEVSDECFVALAKCEIIYRILRVAVLKEKNINVIETVCHKAAYVWEEKDRPSCHKDITSRLTKRFFTIRFKQFSLKGTESLEKSAAIFASKSLAMRSFTKNLRLPGQVDT